MAKLVNQLLYYQEYHRALSWDPCYFCVIAINDLPRSIKSKVRMYADDTLVYICIYVTRFAKTFLIGTFYTLFFF